MDDHSSHSYSPTVRGSYTSSTSTPQYSAYSPVPAAEVSTAYDPTTLQHEGFARPDEGYFGGSRRKSLLKSFRSGPFSRNSRYGLLHEDETTDIGTMIHDKHKLAREHIREVDEEDDNNPLFYDLSGFDGPPIAMSNLSGSTLALGPEGNRPVADPRRDSRLVKDELFLGCGMREVVEAPLLSRKMTGQPPIRAPSLMRRLTKRPTNTPSPRLRDAAQQEATERNEIVVVKEKPTVDITNLGGSEYSNLWSSQSAAGTTSSYYFPEVKDPPNWKPFSMRWYYITLLITMAVTLAALQEYLCQKSLRLEQDGKGLLTFLTAQEISIVDYFSWKYLPTLILVTYGVLWQVVDFDCRRLEPFYQLSQQLGARAEHSLSVDYMTLLQYFIPLKALRFRHYAVVLSTTSTLLSAGLIPVLQSASINLYPKKNERRMDQSKFVRIDPIWSRATTAALLVVAISGTTLLFQLRRKSGLLSNPQGIAGIAAMATRSHILNDFRGLDIASHTTIHKQLRHRRYILHKSSLWQGEFIKNAAKAPLVGDEQSAAMEDPRPLNMRLFAGVVYIGFILIFLISIPLFLFIPAANDVTEKLPFLLTTIATILKLYWNSLECNVRLFEPFIILSRRRAPPRTLTLDYGGTVPGWMPIKATMNGHFLLAAVGFGAILTEVLTVCVASFGVEGRRFFPGSGGPKPTVSALLVRNAVDADPDNRANSGETFKSFWVSFGLVTGSLLYLAITAGIVYAKRKHKFLPRQPGTIASVLAFIHQSKMLLDFVNTEKYTNEKMTEYLEGLGKTYGLGWFIGRDGQAHMGIDYETLEANYVYGVDWRKGRMATFWTDTGFDG